MTDQVLAALRHSLGLNADGTGKAYRNHFISGPMPGDDILEAVRDGLMVESQAPSFLESTDRMYIVTEAGKRVVEEARSAPAKRASTRSQQRYRDYLNADTGLSFGEWLGIGR